MGYESITVMLSIRNHSILYWLMTVTEFVTENILFGEKNEKNNDMFIMFSRVNRFGRM